MRGAGIKPITIALKVDMDDANKQALAEANEMASKVAGAYSKLGTLKLAAIGGAVGAVGGLATALLFGIGAASKFEDSFAGIKKTVDASEAEFDRLAVSIRQLSTEIPIATSQLNQIGELGGQLGIESTGLPVFIETIAKLGVATRLSTDTAALSLARLKEIFQLQEFEISNLASALVDLGNNFAALEDEILSTSLRLAAGAKVAGATVADTLAIATALQAVGVQSQSGGTAMSRVFQQLTVALQGNQKAMSVFVETSGLTEEAFRKIASDDPAQALNLFIQGLSRVGETGGNVVAILDELGLKQQRTIRALLSVAEAGDLLTDALARSNAAYDINNALTEEAEKRFDTLRSKNKALKNAFQELRTEIGLNFLPFMKDVVTALTATINATGNTEKSMDKLSRATVGIVGTFSLLGIAIFAVAGQFVAVRAVAGLAGASLAELTVAANASTGAFVFNEVQINKNQAAYLRLSSAIRASMGLIAPAMLLMSVAAGVNAVSNANAAKSAREFVAAQSKIIPLQQNLNEKIETYQDLLGDSNISTDALNTLKREIEIITEEVDELNIKITQSFFNLPKFQSDFDIPQIIEATKAYNDFTNSGDELSRMQQEVQDVTNIPLFEDIFTQGDAGGRMGKESLLKSLSNTLDLDSSDVEKILSSGDINQLTNAIYRGILINPRAASQTGQALRATIIETLREARKVDVDDLNPFQKIEFEKGVENLETIDKLFDHLVSITGKESEFASNEVQSLIDAYNVIAKQTDDMEPVTLSKFIMDPEVAVKVMEVLAGNFGKTETAAEKVDGRVSDISNSLSEALLASQKLEEVFSGIGEIEIQSPATLIKNIEEYENAQKFLQMAVIEFTDRGMLGLAMQTADAGVNAENIGRTVSLLDKNIPTEQLMFLNNNLIESNEKYADLGETNVETLGRVELSLQTQLGFTEAITSEEEQRLIVNKILASVNREQENSADDYLGAVKTILDIGRDRVDTEEEILELQTKINNFNADLVHDNMTITSEMREQAEIDEAKLQIKEALAEHGADGVRTDKEQIRLLQMAIGIEKMRDKISATRTAREQKSIRDKQKEIKFLELAVEQGVAENLDLDAAKEELDSLTKPLSENEKDVLDLQLKVAEAEKKIFEERSKNLAPEMISALESYNKSMDINKTRASELADMQEELTRKTEDAKLEFIEQGIQLDEIADKYPEIESVIEEMSTLIGVPAGVLQETLDSYNESYEGFISITKKIASATGTGYPDMGAGDDASGPTPKRELTDDKYEQDREDDKKAREAARKGDLHTAPTYTRTIPAVSKYNAAMGEKYSNFGNLNSPDFLTSYIAESAYNPISTKDKFGLGNISGINFDKVLDIYGNSLNPFSFMSNGRAYGGSVPIGKSSVVGEMGPEVIMSTPGGTSVFSNKTGGGYGGVTVENMNVNITGLPADPISARKAAINIRKELTKLENEGSAGTGLRNR